MSESPPVELPPHVLDFLAGKNVMTLATTSSAGVPHASTFLYVNEGPALYFWSRPETTTARYIEQNPVVAFAIDQYSEDLRQTQGVQGSGECSVILNGAEIARVADLFGQKFPDLSPGVTMSISFFRITPSDLQFIDNSASGAAAPEGEFGASFHRESAFSIFEDLPLSADAVGDIGGELQSVEVESGAVVVRQGGPADKFFIVVDGELEVEREEDGATTKVATLGPGRLFGEISILRDTPRTATIKATRPSKLLVMERDEFRDVVAQALGTTAQIGQVMHDRLRTMH